MTEAELSKQVTALFEGLELVGELTFTPHRQHGRGAIPLPKRQKGHPDYSVVRRGMVGYLELKVEGGTLKPEQEAFRDRVTGHGAVWAVAYRMSEVWTFLERLGVRLPPRVIQSVKERLT